jgi:transcription initiation factor TFIIB
MKSNRLLEETQIICHKLSNHYKTSFTLCYGLMRSPSVEQDSTTSCIECGGTNILRDDETGEHVCQTCGMVVSSTVLDLTPEWRAFDAVQREKLPRVGAPVTWTIHDKGLSTNIGWHNQDANGGNLNPEMRARLYRLRKWQRRSNISDGRSRNLSNALNEMSRVQSMLNLPTNIMETSSLLYRKALNANLVRGRTIQSIAVACVYIACRQCGVVRTLDDVAASCNLSKREVARTYRLLFRHLSPSVPQFDPEDFIGRVVSKLSLHGDTERLSKAILRQVSLMKLTAGRGPASVAAACVYISIKITGDHVTQSDISKVAQVTEVTIRNRYKELLEYLEFEIPL